MTDLCALHSEPLPCTYCVEQATGLTPKQQAWLAAQPPRQLVPWINACPKCSSADIRANTISLYHWCAACGCREQTATDRIRQRLGI